MAYRRHLILKVIFISLFIFSITKNINANIVYNKGDLIITEIELNKFISLYKENKNLKLSRSIAIKKLILQKKTINKLLNNQESFLIELDRNIELEFGEKALDDKSLRDFIRYSKIRNEFIINYFNNKFSRKDLKLALKEFTNLTLPLSSNGCMTIFDKMELSKNELFIENLYLKFKENISDLTIIIDDQNYSVCLSQTDLKKIESSIVRIIENKTEIEFKNFIYAK